MAFFVSVGFSNNDIIYPSNYSLKRQNKINAVIGDAWNELDLQGETDKKVRLKKALSRIKVRALDAIEHSMLAQHLTRCGRREVSHRFIEYRALLKYPRSFFDVMSQLAEAYVSVDSTTLYFLPTVEPKIAKLLLLFTVDQDVKDISLVVWASLSKLRLAPRTELEEFDLSKVVGRKKTLAITSLSILNGSLSAQYSQQDRRDLIEIILKRGANETTKGLQDEAALHMACAYDTETDVVDTLLEFHADPKAKKGTEWGELTPFLSAVSAGNEVMVRHLSSLRRGRLCCRKKRFDIQATTATNSQSAYEVALAKSRFTMVHVLLDVGVDTQRVNGFGRTVEYYLRKTIEQQPKGKEEEKKVLEAALERVESRKPWRATVLLYKIAGLFSCCRRKPQYFE